MKAEIKSTPVLLIIISVIVLAYFVGCTRSEVITLTEDTFTDKVKEKDTAWFVKFCVPWCKHCKKLGSLWEDVGKVMEGEDEIEIGEVNCGTSKPVCNKVDIHSYPTFKVFYDGEEVAKYKGNYNIYMLGCFSLSLFVLIHALYLFRLCFEMFVLWNIEPHYQL
ncbi:hypothetical protein IFM89_025526 [Coptis chinensis]|uniref:Thioredoxin domain-containing protein n=1 Tax=Coptis chinensis TaxID=261450 RepID=A0A835H8R8_9MAGN|nr:hypothetical protein IFM89_025526 [Coptis chinensis]